MSHDNNAPSLYRNDDAITIGNSGLVFTFAIDRQPSDSTPTGMLCLSVCARWTNGEQLANYTPVYEDGPARFFPDEISVSDQGLLTAMHRAETFHEFDIRKGITVQLPQPFFTLIRQALASLSVELKGETEPA